MTALTSSIHWIATSDKVPDEDFPILICIEGRLTVEGYCHDGMWFFATGIPIQGEVEFWSEMPEGPI